MAERQGFEPWIRCSRMPDFESGAFNHSAIFPDIILQIHNTKSEVETK